MIRDFEKYHGIVFARLCHLYGQDVSIGLFPTKSNCSYIVNKSVGLYIKHSSKRMSPWQFTFEQSHQLEITLMKEQLGEVFTLFVCHDDGVVCLNYDELREILDQIHEPIEWVRISRRPRGMYSVSGKDGKLKLKIGEKDFPRKVEEYLKSSAI